jgi:hypothetical protein
MARVQTLLEMTKNLRAEAGHSLAVAQGVNTVDTLKYILRRTQEELWTAFIWPEMTLRDDRALTPGTFLYDYSVNLQFDAIREAYSAPASATGKWTPVAYGISEEKIVPVTGVNSEQSDPVLCWEAAGAPGAAAAKFRIWPTPKTATYLRFKGNRELNAFVADADKCTLDATCIILFAASELLARSKAEDAANKLQKAQRHLTKLLGNQVSAKNKVSTFGAGSPRNIIMKHTGINA